MDIHYITPAVTPMRADGRIDLDSCGRLYEHLLAGGADGVLLFGSIGEFFGFSQADKKELISFAAARLAGRTRFLVGTTSLICDEIVDLSRFALEKGADAVIVIPPYYFHFDGEEIYSYYARLATEIPGRLYLYNFPDRTGYSIPADVVRRLAADFDNIAGIKDTISGMDHTRELIRAVRPIRPDFLIYSGFDDNFAHNVLSGGNGCIAGLSNVCPELTSAWAAAARAGDFDGIMRGQQKIDALMEVYAVGKPFVPFIKEALFEKGVIDCPAATAPMPAPTEAQCERLRRLLSPSPVPAPKQAR